MLIDTDEVKTGDLAAILGVSDRRIRQFNQMGLPKVGRGTYNLLTAVRFYTDRLTAQHGGDNTLDEQRQELLLEQTLKTRIENQQKRGELVPIAEVQTAFDHAQAMLAGQLDSFARRMATLIAGLEDEHQIEGVLFDECREVRRAYSDALAAVAGAVPTSKPDPEAPEETDGGGVGKRGKNTPTRKPRTRKVAKQ